MGAKPILSLLLYTVLQLYTHTHTVHHKDRGDRLWMYSIIFWTAHWHSYTMGGAKDYIYSIQGRSLRLCFVLVTASFDVTLLAAVCLFHTFLMLNLMETIKNVSLKAMWTMKCDKKHSLFVYRKIKSYVVWLHFMSCPEWFTVSNHINPTCFIT